MNFKAILKSTIVTEKATSQMQERNKYTFRVAKSATKGQIKEAVEKLYGVAVNSVRVLNTGSKVKRSLGGRRAEYERSPVKKAVVELKEGDTLKVYEGA